MFEYILFKNATNLSPMFTFFVFKHVNVTVVWNKFFLLCIFKLFFCCFLMEISFIIERAVFLSVSKQRQRLQFFSAEPGIFICKRPFVVMCCCSTNKNKYINKKHYKKSKLLVCLDSESTYPHVKSN